MSKVMKCSVCGELFDYGFSVDVDLQGAQDLADLAEDRFEIGKKDVCKKCYYEIKKMLTCCCIPAESEEQNANP
jgi:hypothetical protein